MEESNEIKGALVAPEVPERKFVCKFTIDGEVLVEQKETGDVEHPLKTVDLLPLPSKLKEIHICEMKLFHSLVLTIKKNRPRRTVPVTRSEILNCGAEKKLLNVLVELGYLKEAIIPLVGPGNKSIGSRSCYYYTPQGRALIRAKLDPDYAKTDYQ